MFSFYNKLYNKDILDQIRKIVKNRNWLPEICNYAMLFKIKNEKDKTKLNKTI